MKKATLAQGNQVLNLILQSKVPSGQLQDVIGSGFLSDVLHANVARVNRTELRAMLGLNPLPAPKAYPGEPVLCYVDGSTAYFTTQDLSGQWGDDWNGRPYEHNAERPYGPCWHNEPKHVVERGGKLCTDDCCKLDWNEDGTPKWKIIKVHWEGPFATPAERNNDNSPFSVEDINAGATPWLECTLGEDDARGHLVTKIMAGETLHRFTWAIEDFESVGGKVTLEE